LAARRCSDDTSASATPNTSDAVARWMSSPAKAINFGLIYGMGVFGLASNLGITRDAAQAYIDRYFARYPGVAMYMENTRRVAREQG
ncbi:DNA polymerase, partial [Escherichia coli]|uniref:DNA polymerase n=1 Tax=Escherichia coli TaxID=562 RepID=UPI003B9E3E93